MLSKNIRLALCFASILLSILFPLDAAGQASGSGSITGLLVDQGQAVVPNATVTVTNVETGENRSVETNSSGRFIMPNLRAGKYDLSASFSGFQQYRASGLTLNVGQSLDLTIEMQVASVESSVTVTAETPQINTSQAYNSVVTEQSIRDLPLSGRRFEDLALLTPGVVRSGGTISVGGLQVSGMTSFNIDGTDQNTSMFGRSRGGNRPPFQMSQDAIKEFQVIVSSYSAEFGRVGGGVINAVTKGGTNELHGSVFYYLRDSALGARNPFSSTKAEDRRQQYGGSIGGPIKKNKLFYFFNTDNQKQSNAVILGAGDALNNVRNVGLPEVTAAINRFRNDPAFDRTITPEQGLQNLQQLRTFVESQVGPSPRRFDMITIFPRVDWIINDKLNLNFRYNYQDFEAPNGISAGTFRNSAFENDGTVLVKTHSFGTHFNATLPSNTVLETRIGVAVDDQPDSFITSETSEYKGIPSEIFLTDGQQYRMGSLSFLPRFIKETRYHVVQNVIKLQGNHTLKAGMDILLVDQDNIQTRTVRGEYRFTNLLNLAIGAYRTFAQNLGDPAAPQKAWNYGFFFQDDWKVRPGFTLNLGLRYDLQTFTQPTNPNPLVPETARIPIDRNNFAPRIGFSFSPGQNSRYVIRGGYGISYVPTLTVDTEIFLYRNGVARQLVNFLGPDNASGSDPRAPSFPNIFDPSLTLQQLGVPANSVEVGLAAPNRVNGYIQQANLTYERQLANTLSASVGWLFLRGVHLTGKIHENVGSTPARFRDVAIVGADNRQIGLVRNVPDYDATRRRPNPQLGDLFVNRSEFNSVYHALVASVNKRFSSNYMFSLAYTFAKSIDDSPQQQGADISVPFGLNSLYRGLSNQDVRHRLVFSGAYHQPRWNASSPVLRAVFNGWQLSGIFGYQSGFPYSAQTSTAFTRIRSGQQFAPLGLEGNYAPYGRNTFQGFSQIQNDLRLTRSFNVSEKTRLEFIAEAFNLANHTNLLNPGTTLYNHSTSANFINSQGAQVRAERLQVNPNFGVASGADTPREIQFALRYIF